MIALAIAALLLEPGFAAPGADQDAPKGAVRVICYDADGLFPLGPPWSPSVCMVGIPLGAVCDPDGIALISEAPAGVCTLTVRCMGYDIANIEINVPEGGVLEVDVPLKSEPYPGTRIILPGLEPFDTGIVDTLAINRWAVTEEESLSVVFTDSLTREGWVAWRDVNEYGGLLHLISTSGIQPGSAPGSGPYASDAYLTLAPFSRCIPYPYGPQPWRGQLGLSWYQSRPSDRRLTLVEYSCRIAVEPGGEFGAWSPWHEMVETINSSGLLDYVYAVQVRLHLHTDDPAFTPVVDEVRMIRSFDP